MLGLLAAIAPLCLHAGAPTELTLDEQELEAVPSVAGGQLSALPLLPGTSPLLSPVALSSTRALAPASTGFFLDGLRLPFAFHLFAGPPVVQDAAVAKVTVERGAPDVDRGRLLGGVVDLAPRTPSRDGLSADVTLDLLRAGALAHWAGGQSEVSAGASALWTPALYGRISDGGLRADLGDYYLRGQHAFGATSVRLLVVGAVDRFRSESETDLLGASLSFHRADLRARTPLGEGTAEAALTLGWDDAGAELGGAVARQRARVVEQLAGARVSWTSLLRPWGQAQVGADVERRAADLTQAWTAAAPLFEGEPGDDPEIAAGVRHPIARAVLAGLFARATLNASEATRLTAGLRGDLWSLEGHPTRFTIGPRVGVEHEVSHAVVAHLRTALVSQPPTYLVPLPGAELAGLRFGLQQVSRTEGGLVLRPRNRWTVRLDAWADVLLRAVELSPLDRDFLQTVRGDAADVTSRHASRGTAWGVETLVRRELGRGWFGWVSLGTQQSRRQVRFVVRNDFGEPVDEREDLLPAPLERVVASTAFAGRRVGPWTFSGAARLQGGTLEAGGIGSRTQREGRDRLRPGPRWIEADQDDWSRLPPYFRLDARVAYDFRLAGIDLAASLDVQNLTFSREVTGYSYSERAASLEAEAQGERELIRAASSRVPGVPLPMFGLRGRY